MLVKKHVKCVMISIRNRMLENTFHMLKLDWLQSETLQCLKKKIPSNNFYLNEKVSLLKIPSTNHMFQTAPSELDKLQEH